MAKFAETRPVAGGEGAPRVGREMQFNVAQGRESGELEELLEARAIADHAGLDETLEPKRMGIATGRVK